MHTVPFTWIVLSHRQKVHFDRTESWVNFTFSSAFELSHTHKIHFSTWIEHGKHQQLHQILNDFLWNNSLWNRNWDHIQWSLIDTNHFLELTEIKKRKKNSFSFCSHEITKWKTDLQLITTANTIHNAFSFRINPFRLISKKKINKMFTFFVLFTRIVIIGYIALDECNINTT